MGATSLQIQPGHHLFRVVIGCYSHHIKHLSAKEELRSSGLQDHQICSIGSRSAFGFAHLEQKRSSPVSEVGYEADRYHSRLVRELEIYVSSVSLFDTLWPEPHDHEGSLTTWMTEAQSNTVWRKLCDDCHILMVSADTAEQQIQSSKIQLRHGPAIVQAFNFAV